MRVRKRLSIPLLLGAGLVLFALFEPPPQLLQESAPQQTDLVAPDSYAIEVSMRNFDTDGILLDRTDASVLRRYESAALLELEQPKRWGHEGDSDWIATADKGELHERSNMMRLHGNVHLVYTDQAVEFDTEAMRFNLTKKTALSEAPVRVRQGENETRADQLYAILDWQQARLKGNIRTVYKPDSGADTRRSSTPNRASELLTEPSPAPDTATLAEPLKAFSRGASSETKAENDQER